MSSKNPNFFERLLGVNHSLTSGLARKPHSIVTVNVNELPRPALIQDAFPEAFREPASMQTDSAPEVTRLRKFDTEPVMKIWAKTVEEMAQGRGLDMKDMWALISSRGRGSPLQITTRVNNDMIAARLKQEIHGSVTVFVRLMDLIKAITTQDVPQFAINASMVSYVVDGARNEFPYSETLTDNAVKPAAPPESGYIAMRSLGTALAEAAKWCSRDVDQFGRQAIRVIPKRDGSGLVEVIALCDSAGYRRFIKCKDLDDTLVIVPSWIHRHEKLLGAHVGVRVSGRDYAWMMSASGVALGIEMPELPWCKGYGEYFKGLDGRVEFTHDQVDAIRRGLLQLEPLEVQDPAIGICPTGTGLVLRGSNQTLQAEGMGDAGTEIYINPAMLSEALRTRNVRFLEFDKEDPQNYVRLSGPDICVTIKPLTQPVT